MRLDERAAAGFLAFDICQLAILLYLTGGLGNPFSFLLLAPVAVSATILSLRSVTLLSVLSVVAITILAVYHQPLPWTGSGLELPRMLILGSWVALVVGIVFFALYTWRVAEEARRMSNALAATQLALAREQQLSAVGGLAAAAAHELGSPLGTIAVATREIARDLDPDSPLREDIELLISETVRCRDILAQLSGRSTTDDTHSPFVRLPFRVLVQAAAERHEDESVILVLDALGEDEGEALSSEPMVVRRPEILHGLGNFVQNAIQFADSKVTVASRWNRDSVQVTICDDGPGFPAGLLEKLGEPYISVRRNADEHMGLGIFIACTLLQRSGANIVFGNEDSGGAVVTIVWNRQHIETD